MRNVTMAVLELAVFIVLPILLVFVLPCIGTEHVDNNELKPWEINRPKPPCPFPEENKHWKTPHEWHTWCSVSAFIREANPRLSDEERSEMTEAIIEWSDNYGVPLGLIVAVCHIESNFNAKALGPRTRYGRAHGAMQVMWPVHQGLAESCAVTQDKMLSADGGVRIGTMLLKGYIREEGSIAGGLSRYYSKPSSRYVIEKVMASYLTFEQLHAGLIQSGEATKAHQNESGKLRQIVRGR